MASIVQLNRKTLFAILLLAFTLIPGSLAFTQEIKTATSFFNEVAEYYTGIRDYTADVRFKNEDTIMGGTLYYRRINQLRIDFYQPAEQVIVSDGRVLQIYIPRYNVVLRQELQDQPAAGANLATQEGLSMLKRGYSIGYLNSPNPVALDQGVPGGSAEQVIKLKLSWRSTDQGFREIILSITPSKIIRRVEGITADRKTIRIDYANIRLNQGIPDSRFQFDPDASSNQYDNFLFGNTN